MAVDFIKQNLLLLAKRVNLTFERLERVDCPHDDCFEVTLLLPEDEDRDDRLWKTSEHRDARDIENDIYAANFYLNPPERPDHV